MNLSHFFIDRPIFAAVLSIVIVIVGAVAYQTLPVAQYPEVVPPTIVVRAAYPGASAEVVARTVATPIEQEVNGVEDMLYMSSRCTNDGSMVLTVTFALGTDLNQAQVFVQNRVSIAEPRLPETVRPHRGDDAKELSRPAARRPPALAGPDLRSALHQQLRPSSGAGRDLAYRWRGRCSDVRCA